MNRYRIIAFITFTLFLAPFLLNAQPRSVLVGADMDYAPFTFSAGDHAEGFDIDFFNLLARELSLNPEYRLDHWSSILEAARMGKIDVVLSVLYSQDREEYLRFSIPYNTIQMSLVVKKRSAIRSVKDLAGKRMAALKGDELPGILLKRLEISVQTHYYDTLTQALKSVNSGENAFCITPADYIERVLKSRIFRDLKSSNPEVFLTNYRIGLTRTGQDLLPGINQAIRSLKGQSEYKVLERKWFPVIAKKPSFLQLVRQKSTMFIIAVVLCILAGVIIVRVLLRRML